MPKTRTSQSVRTSDLPVRASSLKRKRRVSVEAKSDSHLFREQASDDESPHNKAVNSTAQDSSPIVISKTKKSRGRVSLDSSTTPNTKTKAVSSGEKNYANEPLVEGNPSSSPSSSLHGEKSVKKKSQLQKNPSASSRASKTRGNKQNGKAEILSEDEDTKIIPLKSKVKKSRKVQSEEPVDNQTQQEGDLQIEKPKKKRKTKEEKEAEAMPLAQRTAGLKMFVGAHTSIAKGVENAITNCVHIGGNAFAMFLKSQRKWENPALKDENRDAFRKHLVDLKYDGMSHVVPHGSYLVNLATEDDEKGKQSYDAFLDDLNRCETLGIRYYNFHPGAAGQSPLDKAIERLSKRLNQALSQTKTVTPLLENMAGHGSIIGGRFSDLRDIIALVKPEYKSRIGVCIDTCHAFASGYDLRTPEAFQKTLSEFDSVVGIKYLKALHLNDSKAPFDSKRDLHQNVGLGFLGLRAFHNVMNEPRFQNLPLILETPCDRPDPSDPTGKKTIDDKKVWAREIKLLESLIGMDPDSEEYETLERDLSKQGEEERKKMQKQFDDKISKAAKKLEKEREKGQTSLKNMFGGQKRALSTKVSELAQELSDESSELDEEDDE